MVIATILVIENEDFVRENILELLDAEGFQSIGADNGRDGIALAQKHNPQLILCDVLMPHLSGYEVLKIVRSSHQLRKTPFVFLSARASTADRRAGLEAGASHYLTKPFSLQELLRVVQSFVDLSQTG